MNDPYCTDPRHLSTKLVERPRPAPRTAGVGRMIGTTPQCVYIGGHRPGYDDECAWCYRAMQTN